MQLWGGNRGWQSAGATEDQTRWAGLKEKEHHQSLPWLILWKAGQRGHSHTTWNRQYCEEFRFRPEFPGNLGSQENAVPGKEHSFDADCWSRAHFEARGLPEVITSPLCSWRQPGLWPTSLKRLESRPKPLWKEGTNQPFIELPVWEQAASGWSKVTRCPAVDGTVLIVKDFCKE